MNEMVLRPIGMVRNEFREPRRGDWGGVASEIAVESELSDYLDGLEEFSHIIVVYWMHRVSPQTHPVGKIHPMGRADLPLVGLFATRSPYRPNPLGVSVVRLVGRKGNILTVEGLDAIDGTPVVDIKPYIPPADAPPHIRVADWVKRYHEGDG